jgi:hypothetical protein
VEHSRPRLWIAQQNPSPVGPCLGLAKSQRPRTSFVVDKFLGFKRYYLRVGFSDDGDFARSRRLPDLRCLYTICGPNDGSAMIAWLLAFLGFPPPSLGSPGSLNRLRSCCRLRTVRRCRSRREPTAHVKRKANRCQQENEAFCHRKK